MIQIINKNFQKALEIHTKVCISYIKERLTNPTDKIKENLNKLYKEKDFKKTIFNIFFDEKFLTELIQFEFKTYESTQKFIKKNKLNIFTNKDNQILNQIFNYSYFSQSNKQFKDWNAYDFVKALGVTVCPYCNRNYTSIVYTKTGKTRPELDHFYPKSEYPYFQLSFYNLIPSCHTCNHSKRKTVNEHLLSPYFYNLTGDFSFKYKPLDIESLLGNGTNFKVKVIVKKEKSARKDNIKNHNDIFLWEKLYSLHGDIIQELIWKKKTRLSEKYLGSLEGIFKNNFSRSEIGRILFCTYLDPADFHKRPLSKFISDIIKDLEIEI